MLEANPFLEQEEDAASAFETSLELAAQASSSSAERLTDRSDRTEGEDTPAGSDEPATLQETDFGTTAQDDWENGTEHDDFDGIRELPSAGPGPGPNGDDDGKPEDRDESSTSLLDHLQAQLAGMRLSLEDRAVLQVLLESLNEDGWLDDGLPEIAQHVAASLGLEDEEALEGLQSRLEIALRWLQSLDPVGVGARDLKECLSLQLRAMTPNPERDLALLIVNQHLELLAKRDIRRLLAETGCDEEELRWAQSLIRQCDPKPGRAFVRSIDQVIIPDVIVQRSGRGFRVVLNPDVMPKLRINDVYAQAMKQHGRSASHLAGHLQEARWFMKNVQQRFETILRVSNAIAERQKNFFSHGEIAMKPLVLREIADELDLHESTISRVTTAKYMSTPFGTYELKYFFGSSLATEAGGNASSTAVRALIKQFVAAEDSNKPLSDSQLSDMLAEQGIQVARRTVAKYREALKIAPASHRKAL